jgi:hypothetical protein
MPSSKAISLEFVRHVAEINQQSIAPSHMTVALGSPTGKLALPPIHRSWGIPL